MKDTKYNVFISYAADDKEWVSEFFETLRQAGKTAWYDALDIRPGDRWQDKIQEALRESDTLILIVSPKTVNSKWVFFELGAAMAGRKRIIPVIMGDVDDEEIHPSLAKFQYVKEDSAQVAGKIVAGLLPEETADGS